MKRVSGFFRPECAATAMANKANRPSLGAPLEPVTSRTN